MTVTRQAGEKTTRWASVALIVGAGIVAAFQVGKVPVALPGLRVDLGLGIAAAAWILSIFNIVGLAVGIGMGGFVARWGARRVALGGLVLLAGASLAGAGAGNAALLLAARLVEGLGFLMVVVAGPSLLMAVTATADRRLVFGAWATYMPAGQAVMMLASPTLLALGGWRGLWIDNAVLMLIYAGALSWATRPALTGPALTGPSLSGSAPTVAPARDRLIADIATTLRAPGPLVLALSFTCYTLQYLAILGFLPTILVEQEHLSAGLAGPLTALAVAANIVGNLAAGVLLQRGARRSTLLAVAFLTMGLCGIGIFALGLPLWPAYGLCVVLSTVGGLIPTAVLGGAPEYVPTPRLAPIANGLMVQGSNLGQVIGPTTMGALAAAAGSWAWSPAILLVAAGAGLGLAATLRRLERRRA